MLKLGTRLVLILFLLSFGLVNSNGYSFPAKPFQIQSSNAHLCKGKHTSPVLEQCQTNLPATPFDGSSNYHDSESSLQATTMRRILSNEQDSSSDLDPVYHLLIDFSPPSYLASLLANTPLLDLKQHWTSVTTSPPSRLAGWKEGNIQYSHFRELLS